MTEEMEEYKVKARGIVRHKFNAVRTELDGIKFASKAEAEYYSRLKLQVACGQVLFFLRQVPFHLPGNVKYICDFQVFNADGTVEFIDVKGYKTKEYSVKKKLVEAAYPVEILERK